MDSLAHSVNPQMSGMVPYENTSLDHLSCTPNKLCEYPGAGVPWRCTDLAEMAAMCTESGFGVLLPQDITASDIALTVKALDDTTLARLRARCAPFIAINNWSCWARNLLSIYQHIAAARAA